MVRRVRIALIAVLGAALAGYVVDLGGSSIWDANEAYYVETPREMIERGDYVNPSFNYEPRFNKPVLSYWIVAGLYQVFGVSVTVQRAAITAAAFVIVAAAYLLARAIAPGGLAPLAAAAGLAAGPRFFMFARRILIDVSLGALMTLVLLCFALAERYPHRRRPLLLAMYVCAGLGVLVKGPVAVVLPALAFLVYLASHRELARIRTMMLPAGALIVLAIVAPWYIALYLESGWTRITEFFIGENLDRFTSLVGPQSRGPLFYLPVVLTDSFPWSLALPAAVVFWVRERRRRTVSSDVRIRGLLLVWIAVFVVFFSLSRTKQDLYIFPIVAAVAALGGDVVARAASSRGPVAGVTATMAVAGLVLAALGALAYYVFGRPGTIYALDGARIAGVAGMSGGIAALVLARRRAAASAVVLLAALVAVNWTLVLRVLPSFEQYKPAVPMSRTVLEHVGPGDAVVHFDVAMPSMVFYLRRHIDMQFAPEELLATLASERHVLAVMPEDRYQEMRADFGRPTCVIDRRPTFDAKLREVLSQRAPPALLVVSTRCQ
jgi:4-amino-4-deoxy-L-arabinose transferase-like glycosyltransferase